MILERIEIEPLADGPHLDRNQTASSAIPESPRPLSVRRGSRRARTLVSSSGSPEPSHPESSNSASDHRRKDSSAYYTTPWGSPYAVPSPGRHWLSLNPDPVAESRDSSPLSMQSGVHHESEGNNNTDIRAPAGNKSVKNLYSDILHRSSGRELFGKKGGKSIKDFTQDWINQYLSGEPRTERGNWLSDDSGSEAPSSLAARNQVGDDPSDDWLGLEGETRDEDPLRTPKLAGFVARRRPAGQRERGAGQDSAGQIHRRSDTLRQEDFWGFTYDQDPQLINMSDTKHMQPPPETDGQKPGSPVEKPLPPPPLSGGNEATATEPPGSSAGLQVPTTSTPDNAASQKPKKRLIWRGKNCIVALPLDDKRGSEQPLLTAEDVEQRLKRWEEEGYDTRGFNVSTDEDTLPETTFGSLSRPSFPDPTEVLEERKEKKIPIRFPNRGEWDSYVNNLQEEKLRALGVSLGDDEPQPSASPASAAVSQFGSFPGLVSSPPIPTGSAASNPLGMPHPFSPQLNQSTNTSNGIGSMASPASQLSIQTPLFGVDQNLAGRYSMGFQPTPPAKGTLSPFNGQSGVPNVSGIHSFQSMLSPMSPFNEHGAFHPGLEEARAFSRNSLDDQFAHDMPEGHSRNQSMRPVHTPVASESQDKIHASAVEIAHPTPRGHNHNVSETLQRGLDDYGQPEGFGESAEAPLDVRDLEPNHEKPRKSDLFKSRWAVPDEETGNAPEPQRESLSLQKDQSFAENDQDDGSDIDTNPSLSGTPRHVPSASHATWDGAADGHKPRLSSQNFNVEAKEFDPTNSFSSQNFFQPAGFGQAPFSFGAAPDFKSSVGSVNSFNVSAPSFAAGNENPLKNTSQSEFKFSSASFNVDAPVFNPGGSVNSTGSGESSNRTKIFGDYDYSRTANPPKKSKAIPIVRPDEKEPEDDKGAENEFAQPTDADRHKRARRTDMGTDGAADVDISPQPLAETHNVQASQGSNSLQPADGKENALPAEDHDDLAYAKTIASVDDMVQARRSTPDSEASTFAAPLEESKDETEDVVTAAPESSAQHEVQHEPEPAPNVQPDPKPEPEKPAATETQSPAEPKEKEQPAEEVSEAPAMSSIFSRITKPFRFHPSVSEFRPAALQKPEPTPAPAPQTARKESNNLMSSRYAPSPPASPKPQQSTERAEPELPKEQMLGAAAQPERGADSPNEEELNAIMDQLNDDSDVGIERLNTPQAANKNNRFAKTPLPEEPPAIEDDADLDTHPHVVLPPQNAFPSGIQSPVRRLANENDQISDWDDVISSGQEEKLVSRSKFFDRRINDLVGSAIEERFSPLERALGLIQDSITSMASGRPRKQALRSTSGEAEESDADDEDDDEHAFSRPRSPLNQRDRKFDKLKNVILEALEAREQSHQAPDSSASADIAHLRDSLADFQALNMQHLSRDPMENMKATMQEVISAQLKEQNSRQSVAQEIGADSLMLQIDGLKNMLRVADSRAEGEYRMRREAQDSSAELQRLLKVAEDEAARHSEAAEDAEARLLQFKAEKLPYFEQMQYRSESMSQEHDTLRQTLSELSTKNITLEGTLDEYRVSSDHIRREAEATKAENEKLRETAQQLKTRVEDSMSARQNMTEKFDRLQEDMNTVQNDVTRDQAAWRRREEEQIARYNELNAAYGREVKLREKLEIDIGELEQQEREAAKLKFVFGQSQQENARLEEMVASVKTENHELEAKAARFEREFNEARDSSRVEIQRTRTSMESDLEAANNQVNFVRAELEAQNIRLQGQLDSVKLDADSSRERYEMLLEEANESKENAINEQRKMNERAVNDLRERQARALHNSSEDRQRMESHLMDRLGLSDDKVHHLQDRVQHLEEKLELAKSAARAAAEAAQGKSSPSPAPAAPTAPAHSTSPSMAYRRGSDIPDKISPQALRESILVLQDQLQQREGRIEELEQEVSGFDKEAPNKLKEKDTEINWLRELLGVRTDDLQDIINTLSQPSFDQNAVRDASIRLKANLQMQLQEKERALSGQSFPSLPSISEITSSPRSLPMAAAAAIGNWRRARDLPSSNLSDQTPSKSTNAGTFLSGLLTPPGSNIRQTPNASAPATAALRRSSDSRPLRGYNATPRPLSARRAGSASMQEPPKTPPLLRKSSYDHDAEPTAYDHGDYGEGEAEDEESTADGLVAASPKEATDGPFGPVIAAD